MMSLVNRGARGGWPRPATSSVLLSFDEVKMMMNRNEGLPQLVNIDIVHSQQSYNWDCGISCIKMILCNETRLAFSEQFEAILKDEDLDTSIWSIDLAFILNRMGVPHVYYTKVMGIDPSYYNEAYYKNVICADHDRVLRKFGGAEEKGVRIVNRILELSEILAHIAKNKPAIVLVDGTRLKCESHFSHEAKRKLFQVLASCPNPSFVGHYVVVCGYDLTKEHIYYRNPGHSEGVCATTFDSFEKARHSHGTDGDIILIG